MMGIYIKPTSISGWRDVDSDAWHTADTLAANEPQPNIIIDAQQHLAHKLARAFIFDLIAMCGLRY